jgi:hypothetical protein
MSSYVVRIDAKIDFRVEVNADDEIEAEDRAVALAEAYARTVLGERDQVAALVMLDGLAVYEVVRVPGAPVLDVVGARPAISPDCEAGKHHACDGGAWDFVADGSTPCTCPHHQAASVGSG